MGSDNKKTHDPVAESDEDTSELEMLPETLAEDSNYDYESESDAATHAFESLNRNHETASLASLQGTLRDRDEAINRLEYDIELLRARSTGLETELAARAELTLNVTTELDQANQKLSDALDRVRRREHKVSSLEEKLRERDERLSGADSDVAKARDEAQSKDALLQERQDEIGSLRAEVAGMIESLRQRDGAVDRLNGKIEEMSRQADEAEQFLAAADETRRDIEAQRETLRGEVVRSHADTERLTALMAANEETIARQVVEIDDLAAELENASRQLEHEHAERNALTARHAALQAEVEAREAELKVMSDALTRIMPFEREHAELSGTVAANRATIRNLEGQLSKIESYADSLRIKLKDQLAERESLSSGRRNAETALQQALQRVDELAALLDVEHRTNAGLMDERRQIEKKFEVEMRTLHSELDAARESIAENQTNNESLASDLIESTGTRRALELQLTEANASTQREIEDLRKRIQQSQTKIEEYQRKIKSKDAAINALLSELATKQEGHSPELVPDVGHKLADRTPPGGTERPGFEKDRVTRLLVGNIEGQELRFPLFKNKLTIGRTTHNDIQLKAQYISRRHAVVVTDDDCTRVVDWGSKNGVYVNGTRVTEMVLKNGDQLTIGTARFRFEERHKR